MGGVSLLTIVALTALSAGPEDLQAQAETSFHEGAQLVPDVKKAADARAAFARSAKLYEQLEADGYHNAALYRNLGNAALLADDLPHAVFAYRRGLRLTPNDLELRRSLAYAREQVTYPAQGLFGRPPTEHRPPWLPRLPVLTPWLAFGFYCVGCLAVMVGRMLRRGPWLTVAGFSFGLAVLLVMGLTWEGWESQQEDNRPLVVVAQDGLLLRRGNGNAYPARYPTPLNKGVEARRLFERGDWLQIELSGGETGWVPRSAVLEDR